MTGTDEVLRYGLMKMGLVVVALKDVPKPEADAIYSTLQALVGQSLVEMLKKREN